MKNSSNSRQKFYECECLDSKIFYQIVPQQIIFLIDEKATSKIANWEKETPYSDREMDCLMGAADGTPSYHLTFFVDKSGVNLIIQRPLNYVFQGYFQGQESQDLIHLNSTNYPQIITKPELVVLKIEGEAYQTLVNWKNWVYEEVFTGRYTYYFFENTTFDQKLITVRDIYTGETLVLDLSEDIYLDFL